jgi:hypothetical protein
MYNHSVGVDKPKVKIVLPAFLNSTVPFGLSVVSQYRSGGVPSYRDIRLPHTG